jgi:predicted MPP superfamily phosphohydrolase
MFLLIVIAVLAAMYGYIGWRLIVPAAFSLPVNIMLWALIVFFLIAPLVPTILRFKGHGGAWLDTFAWIGYFIFGLCTLLFAILVFKDVLYLLALGGRKIAHLVANPGTVEIAGPERRRFLTNVLNLGVLGVTGSLMGYGMYQALRKPSIVNIDVPIANLPENFEGFTIVQISDIHVSSTIKRPFVQTITEMVNGLNPNVIALTGDLVDGSVPNLAADVQPFADLQARHGKYFVTGNHDYYSGIGPWLKKVDELGFTILLNEHRLIDIDGQRLLLGGVTDFEGGRFGPEHRTDPYKAIAGAPDGVAKILLAHQPKSIFEAAKAGWDYLIAGHTHGGQYFPYHFLAALTQPYISGYHRHENSAIYVSRGTGYWGPQIRIGAPSEITVHRLVKA